VESDWLLAGASYDFKKRKILGYWAKLRPRPDTMNLRCALMIGSTKEVEVLECLEPGIFGYGSRTCLHTVPRVFDFPATVTHSSHLPQESFSFFPRPHVGNICNRQPDAIFVNNHAQKAELTPY
jgi:hypothetical protein